jgi:hypothetical protein
MVKFSSYNHQVFVQGVDKFLYVFPRSPSTTALSVRPESPEGSRRDSCSSKVILVDEEKPNESICINGLLIVLCKLSRWPCSWLASRARRG